MQKAGQKLPTRRPRSHTAEANELDTQRYHVPNLERALRVLELLAKEPLGCSISDMARRLTLPKNSVFRIASTLHAHGYLTRDAEARTFLFGRKLLALGYAAVGESNLVNSSLDLMRELRDATGETVLLCTILETSGVIVEQVMSKNPIRFVVDVGHPYPLHSAAPGKAMVAFLPPAEQESLLARIDYPRFNKRTLASRKAYERELKSVHRQGYALDRAEEIEGLHCVAAPIFNHRMYPIAAFCVTAPSYRMPAAEFDRIGGQVVKAAQAVSARFGYGILPTALNEKATHGSAS